MPHYGKCGKILLLSLKKERKRKAENIEQHRICPSRSRSWDRQFMPEDLLAMIPTQSHCPKIEQNNRTLIQPLIWMVTVVFLCYTSEQLLFILWVWKSKKYSIISFTISIHEFTHGALWLFFFFLLFFSLEEDFVRWREAFWPAVLSKYGIDVREIRR